MSFFAADTLIAVPGGTTQISKLINGDMASAWSTKGITEKPVTYNSGTNDGTPVAAIYLETENSKLILSRDQKMVIADHTLKRAEQLIPGVDRLLKADGEPEDIKSLSLINYNRAVHHIAIDSKDHLIIADGFVCGDLLNNMQ